jgi:hypothetical protein
MSDKSDWCCAVVLDNVVGDRVMMSSCIVGIDGLRKEPSIRYPEGNVELKNRRGWKRSALVEKLDFSGSSEEDTQKDFSNLSVASGKK